MGKFLDQQKPIQAQFKQSYPFFSKTALEDGQYKTKKYPHCFPLERAQENLLPEIRNSALEHFYCHEIKWHDGQNGKCSNHMCDSQVSCVNFLFPFADKPLALKSLLLPIYPQISSMLPVESGKFVSFEWIGEKNYLKELTHHNMKRTRGANFTSTDAIVMFERTDGKRQTVLIEWKFTESYSSTDLKYAKSGKDKREIYRHLYDAEDCPFSKLALPDYDSLFFEPFYQLMRQQFLAHEMEKAREMGADIVSLLHIAPGHNRDFKRVTSKKLVNLGNSPTAIWSKLMNYSDRFASVYSEDLFGKVSAEEFPELRTWVEYIRGRYPWVYEVLSY